MTYVIHMYIILAYLTLYRLNKRVDDLFDKRKITEQSGVQSTWANTSDQHRYITKMRREGQFHNMSIYILYLSDANIYLDKQRQKQAKARTHDSSRPFNAQNPYQADDLAHDTTNSDYDIDASTLGSGSGVGRLPISQTYASHMSTSIASPRAAPLTIPQRSQHLPQTPHGPQAIAASSPLARSEISYTPSSPTPRSTLRTLLPRPPQPVDMTAAHQQHRIEMQHLHEKQAMLQEKLALQKKIAELEKQLKDSA